MQPGSPACDNQASETSDATHEESLERTLIDRIGLRNYDAFLRNHTRFRLENSELLVLVSKSFVMELLQSRYRQPLLESARAVYGPLIELRFLLAQTPNGNAGQGGARSRQPATSRAGRSAPTAQRSVASGLTQGNHSQPRTSEPSAMHADSEGADVENIPLDRPCPPGVPCPTAGESPPRSSSPPAGSQSAISAAVISDPVLSAPGLSAPVLSGTGESAPVNSPRDFRRFGRLDEFVDGPKSRAALAAARDFASADDPPPCLYLFGPTGVGKTHLLEGIWHSLKRRQPETAVMLLSAEQFTNQFTSALRASTTPGFRAKFRSVDVLLIDDVDFLDGKHRVQDELLHTLQQLEQRGKRYALAADRHPKMLSHTRHELQTRFLAGLTVRIDRPDQATREKIVAHKALLLGMMLTSQVIRIISEAVQSSVRELEGTLHNLRNLHRASGLPMTPQLARTVVDEIERDCRRVIRLPDIERVICETFGVSVEDLRSDGRKRSISTPRMLAMFLARKHTGAAYAEIGAYFGGRNHATVISAEKKIRVALETNASIRVSVQNWTVIELIDALEQRLIAS